jgi:hypothetical protein
MVLKNLKKLLNLIFKLAHPQDSLTQPNPLLLIIRIIKKFKKIINSNDQ